jgi:glutamate-1-semialdehyde 2,1-aminomutase
MRAGLREVVADCGFAADVTGVGSLFHVHFTDERVRSAREAEDADQALITELHERLLAHGIYFYCGRLGFLSAVHASDEVGMTLGAVKTVLEAMKEERSQSGRAEGAR